MTDILYRAAMDADAEALAAFFAETFRETFGHLYRSSDLDTFLAQHRAESWLEQIRASSLAIRIVEHYGSIAGFAKLGPVQLPVASDAPSLEIRQIYVAPGVRGTGVAASLMQWLLQEAKARGARHVFLSVYTDNERARRFYGRYGFVDLGPCIFMVGNQADEDRIMRATLD